DGRRDGARPARRRRRPGAVGRGRSGVAAHGGGDGGRRPASGRRRPRRRRGNPSGYSPSGRLISCAEKPSAENPPSTMITEPLVAGNRSDSSATQARATGVG